jgi:3-oxoacyl-(acyl-carrier-protein) synthase
MKIPQRVVITGMGVVASNANGLNDFEIALREGKSGIRHYPFLNDLNFTCQVAGVPQNIDVLKQQYLKQESLLAMNSSMVFSAIAAIDCWKDAGFQISDRENDEVDWDTGAMIGTGIGGADTMGEHVVPYINQGDVKRLGSTAVEQAMTSSSSANIGGLLGLGGQVTTNSSACTTGTEAIAQAFFVIKEGRLKRVLAGATEGASHYIWGGFDAMRVLARGFNEMPAQASRPMSATASGFVPGSGAGILMLESLESAQERGAKIYAEIIGAHVNCGGQRNGGSISIPNPQGIQRCIRAAIEMANISPAKIDLINGHLTATKADPFEVQNWQQALQCSPSQLPLINSTKSLIGHALCAAGGIECVASILQLSKGFVHGSINCEDLHPKLEPFSASIVRQTKNSDVDILAKASFGFGDVNGCLIFKRWHTRHV